MSRYWHNLSIDEAIILLDSDTKEGLTEKEVKKRQEKFGKNELPKEKEISFLKIFFDQFKNPLIYILLIAGIITLLLHYPKDATVIFGAVFLNTLIGFFQENRTAKILSQLKSIVKVKAHIIREGKEREIDQEELVPGDIILLSSGNKVPADSRIIECQNLKINESSLTGEWIPAEKKRETLSLETALADRDNMVYMGCVVEEGRGMAIVVKTGQKTEIGKIATMISESKEEKTPYQKRIITLSKIIASLIVFLSLALFIFGIFSGRDFFEMFLVSVSVAVASIPEGLPIAITIILAIGMQRILKKEGLVRKMVAAETLGSASVICTDKTGTITEGKMQIAGIFANDKEFIINKFEDLKGISKNNNDSNFLALKIITIVSEAFIENPNDEPEKWLVRGRATDKALLLAGALAGFDKKELLKEEPKIGDILFDSFSKYSASLHKLKDKNVAYFIGAPEVILNMSKYIDSKELSKEKKEELNKKSDNFAKEGQRVIGVAFCEYQKIEELSHNLTFVGLVSLKDPIRKEVSEAIRVCVKAGIRPIIITGDHKLTALSVAKEIGLPYEEKNIIEGAEMNMLTEEQFSQRLSDIYIYARVEPRQKLKIIEAWQKRGEIVAMTGDGINDAPALKKADIGIALGSGTDVAKESSDVVLLNNNFSIIISAIEEGRIIIDNIKKTITLLLSQCSSEIILIGTAIVAGLPLPILPAQILWENLIEGSPQGIALAFEPKEKGIMKRKPEDPHSSLLTTQMKTIVIGFGIVTDFILFGLFFWLYNIWGGDRLNEIRTIIFAALTIDTLFYAFSCKNLRKNIWQYNIFSNLYLVYFIAFSLTMLLLAIYLPIFQNLLKTVPLNLFAWQLLLSLGLLNLVLIELIKWVFIIKSKKNERFI